MADDATSDTTKGLVPRLLQAGAGAPKLLLEAASGGQLGAAAKYVEGLAPGDSTGDVEPTVDKVVKAHRMMARTEGAAAGLTMSAAEMTTIVGTAGTTTLPVAAVTLGGRPGRARLDPGADGARHRRAVRARHDGPEGAHR